MLHRIDNTTSSLPAEEAQELRRLLSGVAAGNRDDLAQLYRRTRTAVYGLALSYLRNAHDAQDLTQDVYVHIWDTADRYRPTGSPIGWVLAVCRNLCLMHLRRADRQVTMEDREWYAIPSPMTDRGWTPRSGCFCRMPWLFWEMRSVVSFCCTQRA